MNRLSMIAIALAFGAFAFAFRVRQQPVVKLNNIPLKAETLLSIPHAARMPIRPSIEGIAESDRQRTWMRLEIPGSASISHSGWREDRSTTANGCTLIGQPVPGTDAQGPGFTFPEINWLPGMGDVFDLMITAGVGSNRLFSAHVACAIQPGFGTLSVAYGRKARSSMDAMLVRSSQAADVSGK